MRSRSVRSNRGFGEREKKLPTIVDQFLNSQYIAIPNDSERSRYNVRTIGDHELAFNMSAGRDGHRGINEPSARDAA